MLAPEPLGRAGQTYVRRCCRQQSNLTGFSRCSIWGALLVLSYLTAAPYLSLNPLCKIVPYLSPSHHPDDHPALTSNKNQLLKIIMLQMDTACENACLSKTHCKGLAR